MLVSTYLAAKAQWSRFNDWWMYAAFRSPVPKFSNPQDAAKSYFFENKNPYTGDPLGGIGDFYLHPERLSYALQNGTIKGLSVDCDDVALFYYQSVKDVCEQIKLVTLVDSGAKYSHTVCVGVYQGKVFALDTNGYTEPKSLSEKDLCEHWGKIYTKANFFMAVDTQYPF